MGTVSGGAPDPTLPPDVDAPGVLAAVLRHAREIALLVAPDGTVRWVSEGWFRKTGRRAETLVGRPHDAWVREADRHRVSLDGPQPAAHRSGLRFRVVDVRGRDVVMSSHGGWFSTGSGPLHLLVWADVTALDAFGDGLVALSRHEPLPEILRVVLRGIEARFEAAVAWVQEVYEDGRLRHLAGPNLPSGWLEAVDGAADDDPRAATSRASLYEDRMIVADLEAPKTDPPFAETVRGFGFRALWAAPIREEDGAILGVLTLLWTTPRPARPDLVRLLDIAASVIAVFMESARARAELQQAHRRLTFHMDNSPLAVVETDRRFRITRWSDKAEEMLGHSAPDVLGRPLGDLGILAESDRERGENVLRELHRSTLRRGVIRLRMKPRDGREIDAEWHVSALRDDEGAPRSYMGLGQDLSERQAREEALRHTQKLETVGVLAGGIAHDFNNLLTSVLGHADRADRQLEAGSAARQHVERITEAAERAAELTRQLLAYSGEGRFELRHLDLDTCVSEMGDLLRASVSKRVDLRYDLADEAVEVEADPAQVHQLVLSLVANASEATETAGGTVVIATRWEELDDDHISSHFAGQGLEPGPYAVLEVRDTGCGMDGETMRRALDPYFSTKGMGRGLGLAAIAGIARGHRGGIRMDSELGVGTTVSVYLPAARPSRGSARDTTPAPRSRPDDRRSRERRAVLVVDDEAWVRQFVGEVLGEEGYNVLYAVDGREALGVFEEHRAHLDLVILDMTMPRMGGVETLEALRTLDPDVRVLVTSGYAQDETTSAFDAHEPDGFLQKPFRLHVLLDKVAELTRSTSSDQTAPGR